MRPCSFYFIYPLFSQSDFNHRLSSKLIIRFLRFQETGPPSYPWFHHLPQKHQAPVAAAAKVPVSNYGLTHQRTCAINLSNISRPGASPSVGSSVSNLHKVRSQPILHTLLLWMPQKKRPQPHRECCNSNGVRGSRSKLPLG